MELWKAGVSLVWVLAGAECSPPLLPKLSVLSSLSGLRVHMPALIFSQ